MSETFEDDLLDIDFDNIPELEDIDELVEEKEPTSWWNTSSWFAASETLENSTVATPIADITPVVRKDHDTKVSASWWPTWETPSNDKFTPTKNNLEKTTDKPIYREEEAETTSSWWPTWETPSNAKTSETNIKKDMINNDSTIGKEEEEETSSWWPTSWWTSSTESTNTTSPNNDPQPVPLNTTESKGLSIPIDTFLKNCYLNRQISPSISMNTKYSEVVPHTDAQVLYRDFTDIQRRNERIEYIANYEYCLRYLLYLYPFSIVFLNDGYRLRQLCQ